MARSLRTLVVASAALVVSTLSATDAKATAQRTFVASYGSPGNTAFNCSIVKPCRAFSDAISVTNPGGEAIVLDSAGYGPVTITQPVSIIAPPGIYAGISVFSGDGITVNAPGAIVVLRGLTINGQGGLRGISFLAGARLRIENCVISGMSNPGISHVAAGGEMIVLDTVTRDNGGEGVIVYGDSLSVVLDHVRSENNQGRGFFLGPTAGSAGALATIVDSVFTYNGLSGVEAVSVGGSTVSLVVERSVSANNSYGFSAYESFPGASTVVATIARSTANDNKNYGILLEATRLHASIFSNVVQRNFHGIHINGGPAERMDVLMKDNIAKANNTDLVCHVYAPGYLYTDKSNLFGTTVLSEECLGTSNVGF